MQARELVGSHQNRGSDVLKQENLLSYRACTAICLFGIRVLQKDDVLRFKALNCAVNTGTRTELTALVFCFAASRNKKNEKKPKQLGPDLGFRGGIRVRARKC